MEKTLKYKMLEILKKLTSKIVHIYVVVSFNTYALHDKVLEGTW